MHLGSVRHACGTLVGVRLCGSAVVASGLPACPSYNGLCSVVVSAQVVQQGVVCEACIWCHASAHTAEHGHVMLPLTWHAY